ncbi:MAG: DUF2062 domain-containing protein [Vicinamibacterales bacterium]
MWHASREVLRRHVQSLLHTHDTPQRTAVAIGLGVFVGFSPFLGLHIVMALLLAFMFRLNRVAVLAGMCVNLPWFMGAYYAATTALGTWMLGSEVPPHLLVQLESIWELPHMRERIGALGGVLEPLLWPFTLGSLLCAAALGVLAYWLALPVLVSHRRRHPAGQTPSRP